MWDTDNEFENEVRRIARLLWPSGAFGGSVILEGRERDGVFETDEAVHIVECTLSRTKLKAEEDGEKLSKGVKFYRQKRPEKAVKGWFVTLDEPTADQRTVINGYRNDISALSYDQFSQKLIDAKAYLERRKNYPFGSVADPETGHFQDLSPYVELGIVTTAGETMTLQSLEAGLDTGQKFVLLGDFGAGKSMTMRELFRRLASRFYKNKTRKFPILLNLREHIGQTEPAEALERHARSIGFDRPSHLIRALNAGQVILLLDGFDEMATTGWASQKLKLRDIRRRSMTLVRRILANLPLGIGYVISGRDQYFDSPKELREAMALDATAIQLNLHEFTDDQMAEYLRGKGWENSVPEWLPSRPLLLGYLASRDLLKETLEVEIGVGSACGWDSLLQRICEREAKIEAGIDGATVRRIIERIASRTRGGASRVSDLQLRESFEEICAYSPDDAALILLQRLPGLGVASADDGTRQFIDPALLRAASAGDVFEYIRDPYGSTAEGIAGTWQESLAHLGVEVVAHRCVVATFGAPKISTAALKAGKQGCGILAADIVQALRALNFSFHSEEPLFIDSVIIPEMTISDDSADFSRVHFQSCWFVAMELDPGALVERLPQFSDCDFGTLIGRLGHTDLPADKFDACTFDEFEDGSETTAAILSLGLPEGTKVLLTILKKLYLQKGRGRRERAFYRGLDHRAQRLVTDVLDLVRKHGFAIKSTTDPIWLPVRAVSGRVRKMIAAPNTTRDILLEESATIA